MAMNNIKIDIREGLVEAIDAMLEKAMTKEFDRAIENLNSRKREIVAGVLLDIMKQIDMEQISDRTIFTIKEVK